MNPRQRRGVLLIVIALVGAVGVFAGIAAYVSDVRKEVGPKVTVYQLVRAVPANAPVPQNAVRPMLIPRRWMPDAALRTRAEIASLVAVTDLDPGSLMQQDMLKPPPQLGEGQRELAILIDAETGVAGKLAPGDLVDIDATFAGDQSRGTSSRAVTVVPGARILEIGDPAQGNQTSTKPGVDPKSVVPITFALAPSEALSVTYAESFADEVRLALLRNGETVKARTQRQFRLPKKVDATPVAKSAKAKKKPKSKQKSKRKKQSKKKSSKGKTKSGKQASTPARATPDTPR